MNIDTERFSGGSSVGLISLDATVDRVFLFRLIPLYHRIVNCSNPLAAEPGG
jgi:hypothetical protein